LKKNKGKKAPIAVFIYNRPNHTRRALKSLQCCFGFSESPLYIFCDGPKTEGDNDVQEARNVAKCLIGDHAVLIESAFNQGLANSIVKGVSRLCREYGKVIVIEDDLLVAPSFLNYMNDALELYEYEESVMQVSGHMFSVPKMAGKQEAFFLPFTTSWGWATWKRAWDSFDLEATGWEQLKTDKKLRFQFNLDNSYDYYSMLEKQMTGRIDSWAIRWYWSVFQHDGLVLYPPLSLIENIGFDGTGTHGWRSARLINVKRDVKEICTQQCRFPSSLKINASDFKCVKEILQKAGFGYLSKSFQLIKRKFS